MGRKLILKVGIRMLQAALDDYINGVPVDDILSKHGVTKTTFWRWIKKAGIVLRGSKPRFTDDEIIYINSLYSSGKSIREISRLLNSAEVTISPLIDNKRTISEQIRTFSDGVREAVIQSYIDGMPAKEAGLLYDVSEPSVLRFLEEAGIERRKIEYDCNENYFDNLDTPEKFYWLGFFMADGRLALRKNASWHFESNLGMKDKHHLQRFAAAVGYTGPIRDVTVEHTKNGGVYHHANLKITRIHLVKTLMKHGLKDVQNGSIEPLQRLTDEQLRWLILGYFDGDGSIGYQGTNLYWYICGPFKEPLEYMMSRCPVVDRFNVTGAPNKYRVVYGGNIIAPRICKWLYKDMLVFLQRKRCIYDDFVARTTA